MDNAIGEILVRQGIITKEQLEEANKIKKDNERLEDVLITINYASEVEVLNALSEESGLERVSLFQYPANTDLVKLLSEEFEIEHGVLPLDLIDGVLSLAVNRPLDVLIAEDITLMTGYQIEQKLSTKNEIESIITKIYNLEKSLGKLDKSMSVLKDDNDDVVDEENPLVKFVNQIIINGVMEQASDIHITPGETDFVIRYRIDGDLIVKETLPKHLFSQVLTRVKVMSKLDITEERLAQDGRIKTVIQNISLDLRISTLPTIHGENLVIRILDLSTSLAGVDDIGLSKEDLDKLKKAINMPNGIVLVSGPTGSGKSTTLYACLTELNKESTNIITVEDPVEMQIAGLKQVQANEDLGLTFSSVLRSVLRQDPDIIMVGEIRDADTAAISIRAALTGHLVLSTIHTNSSIKTLTRLFDIGIDPYLVSDSLNAVIAQRLVKLKAYDSDLKKVKHAHGCDECGSTGYRGRMPLFEILEFNDEIRYAVAKNESIDEIMKLALKNDFKTLAIDGIKKVEEGLTTLDEIMRVVR